jgi:uncharacterized membrane protein
MITRSYAYKIAMSASMAALSFVLGYMAIPGPWNIKFGLTAIPIFIAAFTLGPFWGALTGLLGGISQALNYGSMFYVIYTAIQGGVAGYFAQSRLATKWVSPIMGFAAGFFLVWWIDLLREGNHSFQELSSGNIPIFKSLGFVVGFPIVGLIAGVLGAVVFLILAFCIRDRHSFLHLFLAGAFGSIAYVPYDAFVLNKIQLYPWIPTWFVLSKDLVQDLGAALLCAWIYQNTRLSKALLGSQKSDS